MACPYHALPTNQSGAAPKPAWRSRKQKLWLGAGFSGFLVTVMIASGLSYDSPTGIVTQFLEAHEQAYVSTAETFVRIAADTDIDGPFDYKALAALCKNTTWREGLVFRLRDSTGGGIGNVKNAFLNSLRFSIEAGASYVMPRILHRDPCDIAVTHTSNIRDFSYLFDRAHFKSSLKAACPMMTIYDDFDALGNYSWAKESTHLTPNSLDDVLHGYTIAHPHEWRPKFDHWLGKEVGHPSAEEPIMITLDHAFLLWPILSDPPALVRTFGRVLRSPRRMRRLAARVIYALSARYALAIDPSIGLAVSSYFGVHLRTESDAAAVGWADYNQQASACLEVARATNSTLIYAASGDPEHLAQLTSDAMEQHGITVVTKSELLRGEDLEELKSMSWDQQALVDYEVMLKSSFFAGLQQSSFSYSIAVRRHSTLMSQSVGQWWTDEALDPNQRPWWNERDSGSDANESPHDLLSTLLGDREAGYMFESTIWP